MRCVFFFFFQAEDGIRDLTVTGVQTCALPISDARSARQGSARCSGRSAGLRRGRGASCRFPACPPSSRTVRRPGRSIAPQRSGPPSPRRSEEHTSELQSQSNLVCRLLLEKKKNKASIGIHSSNSLMLNGCCPDSSSSSLYDSTAPMSCASFLITSLCYVRTLVLTPVW